MNVATAETLDSAERRRFDFMNTSASTFVKIGVVDADHELYGPHYLTIQLFLEDLPLSCQRFMTLCKNKPMSPGEPSYIGSSCSRIQKGEFIQFGKVEGGNNLPPLHDEHFIHHHDEPGMVGFIGGKTTHTNKCEFYITLAPMRSFDYHFVVFGRVVEGLQFLKKASLKQDPHSLLPSTKLKIQEITVFEKKPTVEAIRRQKDIEGRKAHAEKSIVLKNHADILAYIEEYQRAKQLKPIVKGPEHIEIRNLHNNDDLYVLSEIPLSHVETIVFKDCQFHTPSHHKIFKHCGFFQNVVNWEFYDCDLTKDILKTFFINKATKQVKTLIIKPNNNGHELFSILTKWKKLEHVTSLAFIGSLIGKTELEAFSKSKMFSKLEYLDLSDTKFYDDGLMELVTNFNNNQIKGIFFKNTGITSKLALALLQNKVFSNLEVLDLSDNFNMDPAIHLIAASKHLNNLHELYFRNTYLTIPSLYELVCSHNFSTVKRLDLSNNFAIKDDLAAAMIEKPFIRSLEMLNLENCDISNETIKRLSENSYLGGLKELDISNNPRVKVATLFEELENTKFIHNLKRLCMANVGATKALQEEIKAEFKLTVETEPMVGKDYSDYLHHVNEIHDPDSKAPGSPSK